MTEQEMNEATAKECGWKFIPEHDTSFQTPAGNVTSEHWVNDELNKTALDISELPKYTQDLNAMHEAEKVLTKDEFDDKFYYHIGFVVSGGQETQLWQYRKLIVHATALQRAEAFCRTLWPEKF